MRPRVVLEDLTALSADELREASYAAIRFGWGSDRLSIWNDRERPAIMMRAVKVTNLSDFPLTNVNLTFELRYFGGNLPFYTEEMEEFSGFEVGTILAGSSKFISFRSLCPFPVSMYSRGASVADDLRQAGVIEIANLWYTTFPGQDSDFERDSLIDSWPHEGQGIISHAMVERREFFFTFKYNCGPVLALATVDCHADGEAHVIFTYTLYGVSPVNGAEKLIDEFEKQRFLSPKVKRRYFAYFPSSDPQFRHLTELKYYDKQMTFPRAQLPIESEDLNHLDDVVSKLHAHFDPTMSQSSM
jgi:hypothetical protein